MPAAAAAMRPAAPLGIGGPHQIAWIDLAQADAAVHRRQDAGVRQLHLGGVHRRLVAVPGRLQLLYRRRLLFQHLPGDQLVAGQVLQAGEVRACGIQRSAVTHHCGLRAAQISADRAIIDAGQQLSLAHLLAFLEQHLGEHAIDLGPQHRALQ
ncbi:hypothetical protein G6F31_018750 [Rhizopus arrhizus]|nr:hypothetical protein G6F31_018750 [Rhizopus arrhizus]